MRVGDLAARNAETLRRLEIYRAGDKLLSFPDNPYYGFYDVDLFDCPPFVMFTAADCMRAQDIVYHRKFEPQSMKIWCRLVRTATGIVDIGAHVGIYSLAAASLRRDIPVHAFEPNPFAYARLRLHKTVNGFDNIVEHRFGVVDQSGHATLKWRIKPGLPISSGSALDAADVDNVESIDVPIAGLSAGFAATLGAKPIVKIDVEGVEAATVRGCRDVLALQPDILIETFQQKACDSINQLLQLLPYQVYLVREGQGDIVPRDKLYPCDRMGQDFNQFLTVRPHDEVMALLA